MNFDDPFDPSNPLSSTYFVYSSDDEPGRDEKTQGFYAQEGPPLGEKIVIAFFYLVVLAFLAGVVWLCYA